MLCVCIVYWCSLGSLPLPSAILHTYDSLTTRTLWVDDFFNLDCPTRKSGRTDMIYEVYIYTERYVFENLSTASFLQSTYTPPFSALVLVLPGRYRSRSRYRYRTFGPQLHAKQIHTSDTAVHTYVSVVSSHGCVLYVHCPSFFFASVSTCVRLPVSVCLVSSFLSQRGGSSPRIVPPDDWPSGGKGVDDVLGSLHDRINSELPRQNQQQQ